ncbi:MAG: NADH-quinone oxidoreductase subunit NuoE [Gammaproteobacteria bacterium]|nr:NADH-quinone oxidoreductase subunit NuoE [Gammaproteobacteria bacterium]
MVEKTQFVLSEAAKSKIDSWLAKYPPEQKRSAVIPALHIAQDENQGWLSDEAMEAVADYLGLPKMAVFEVATFYSMYNLKPIGKHQISVCTNVSCMLKGSDKIAEHFKNKLGISFNETTSDGNATLKEVECLAACAGAPACMIDKTYYENLTPEKIDELLRGLSST